MKKFAKSFLLFLYLFLMLTKVSGQKFLDSLRQDLLLAKQDTARALALYSIADYYAFIRLDSTSYFANKAIDLSNSINFPYGRFCAQTALFFGNIAEGDYPKVQEIAVANVKLADQLGQRREHALAVAYNYLGLINRIMSNNPEALANVLRAINLLNSIPDQDAETLGGAYCQLGAIYSRISKPDSVMYYLEKGYAISTQTKGFTKGIIVNVALLADGYLRLKNYALALEYYHLALQLANYGGNRYLQTRVNNNLSDYYLRTGVFDSCVYYAGISLALCRQYGFANYAMDAYGILSRAYDSRHQTDSAYKYMQKTLVIKDSLFSQARIQQFLIYDFNEKQKQQEIEADKAVDRNRQKMIGLSAGLAILFLLAMILYRNNLQRRKSNLVLKQQKDSLENALGKLKSTQAQLIHAEKMASLGELTAGIAHEIQNPLNFVNNFSEVNTELIDEMQEELDKGNTREAKIIASNLRENNVKIEQHGKRADGIVKGMLEHSRSTTAHKELVNLQSVIEEYLKLSFHPFRVKDKSFNARIVTDYDNSIGKIALIQQDLGKVLINLLNNAYYAVSQKARQTGENYEPTVFISTKKKADFVEIRVGDNGIGIADKIMDKVFQPFFTTKPAGQGTGLGLSLSYDLIKAQGGNINIEPEQKEGACFVIELPAS